jgi:L-ribulokinase
MSMGKYTIGIDYGTLSGRAVLVNVENGTEVASSVYEYLHAVMDKALPDGTPLPHDYALQHPQDYLDVLYHTIPDIMRSGGVSPDDVIGVGTDFTACTVLPITQDGTPLCFLSEYRHRPHAYVKLWKHHAAQDKANLLNAVAAERGEAWLKNYGGKISSEWAFPKLMQVLDEAPDIYNAMHTWAEAADWIVWQLTGNATRNSCCAGYKAMYNKRTGYPGKLFFKALDARMENVIAEKFSQKVSPLGERAGGLTAAMAQKLGLNAGTAVCIGNVDAHVCVPAVGIDSPAQMLAIMGTSTCHMVMGTIEKQVPGMCGVVEDGILPGFLGYEAGQSCVGDHFAWFVDHLCPAEYRVQAKEAGVSIHEYLSDLAEKIKPGESGLLALDWWNGNRSVLVDVDLTGMILGMTLQTTAEEIYKALIEATAFGTRMIVENYRNYGVPVERFYASGGISLKNPMLMQIYSDVLNLPIYIAGSSQGPALGSAIFAAVAAGQANGGYGDVFTAARHMGKVKNKIYQPIPENALVYDKLFDEYRQLHDYFGRGTNNVMKRLKEIRK